MNIDEIDLENVFIVHNIYIKSLQKRYNLILANLVCVPKIQGRPVMYLLTEERLF